ncbi:hypothetical protein [Winogradskyella sp. A2]|uniref:hypothetical protein n=1 Tax=Winogradskyella sp. A2 TaxID=3366944 RepID=UPI00398C3D90
MIYFRFLANFTKSTLTLRKLQKIDGSFLAKLIFNKWGTVKIALNDMFDSVEFNGGTNLPEQNIKTDNLFDFSNRTIQFTYTRNFGNSKLKSARDRNTVAEDERQRVN